MSMKIVETVAEYIVFLGCHLLVTFILWKITSYLKQRFQYDVNTLPDQTFSEKIKAEIVENRWLRARLSHKLIFFPRMYYMVSTTLCHADDMDYQTSFRIKWNKLS